MNRSRSTLTVAAAALFFTGACSTTRSVARPASLTSFAVTTEFESRPIDLVVGRPVATAAVAGADPWPENESLGAVQLVGVTPAGIETAQRGGPRLLQLDEIRGYDVRTHANGAIEGLGWGLVAGATVGVVAGFIAGDDPPCDQSQGDWCSFQETAGQKAVIGGVLGGITGALSGLVIGALIGHTDHTVFF
jgi:hypothetical protein